MPIPFLGELAALATSLFFSIGPTFFTLAGRLVGSAIVNRSRLLVATLILIATTAIFSIFKIILPAVLYWQSNSLDWNGEYQSQGYLLR